MKRFRAEKKLWEQMLGMEVFRSLFAPGDVVENSGVEVPVLQEERVEEIEGPVRRDAGLFVEVAA